MALDEEESRVSEITLLLQRSTREMLKGTASSLALCTQS